MAAWFNTQLFSVIVPPSVTYLIIIIIIIIIMFVGRRVSIALQQELKLGEQFKKEFMFEDFLS